MSFAIDAGERRIGVARCDADRILALPVATVPFDKYGGHFDEILALIDEYGAKDIYVGLPLHLSGHMGASAQKALRFARRLAGESGLPVRLVDERLTTVQAHAQLRASGRDTRSHRSVVDQASAVVLLDQVLETERRTGNEPGRLVK